MAKLWPPNACIQLPSFRAAVSGVPPEMKPPRGVECRGRSLPSQPVTRPAPIIRQANLRRSRMELLIACSSAASRENFMCEEASGRERDTESRVQRLRRHSRTGLSPQQGFVVPGRDDCFLRLTDVPQLGLLGQGHAKEGSHSARQGIVLRIAMANGVDADLRA